jgi:hypothetical protein
MHLLRGAASWRPFLTATDSATQTVRIIGSSDYLQQSAERLNRLVRRLRPLLIVAGIAAVVGWLIVVITTWRDEVGSLDVLIGIVAIITLGALALPWLIDQLRTEATAHEQAYAGVERVGAFFSKHLDQRWTLLHALSLPGQAGDLDAVLVGPGGCYCLRITAFEGFVRNKGNTWSQRVGDDDWQAIRPNPTQQIEIQLADLNHFLHKKQIAVAAKPRIVCAGPNLVLEDNPAIPLWHLNRGDQISAELTLADPIDTDTITAIVAALETHIRHK